MSQDHAHPAVPGQRDHRPQELQEETTLSGMTRGQSRCGLEAWAPTWGPAGPEPSSHPGITGSARPCRPDSHPWPLPLTPAFPGQAASGAGTLAQPPAVPAAVSVGCGALSRHLLGVGEGRRGCAPGRESRALQSGGSWWFWVSEPWPHFGKGWTPTSGLAVRVACGVQHPRGAGQASLSHWRLLYGRHGFKEQSSSSPKRWNFSGSQRTAVATETSEEPGDCPSPWGCPDPRCYLGTCGLVLGSWGGGELSPRTRSPDPLAPSHLSKGGTLVPQALPPLP